jgi:molybdopterin molybdotransferase
MQEECEVLAEVDGHSQIRVNAVPKSGQWIRRAGEDVALGAVVLQQGERLTPASLGLAASIGLATLPVVRRPKVALFSTGDELVMPGDIAPQNMPAGSIYNSNRFFLRTLLQRLGCEVTDMGIVPDNLDATKAALSRAAQGHDLILTSGGVSVGEEDHIKPAVQALGELNLWQIAIKPGKPFAYGKIHKTARPEPVEGSVEASTLRQAQDRPSSARTGDSCHFIGLPGNPVSSFVTFLLLVRPFLLTLQGMQDVAQITTKSIAVRADFTWAKADMRREFLRVKRNAAGGLDLFPNQSSGILTSVSWGDGLVNNPPGQTIAIGDMVQWVSFAELLS